MKNTRNAKHAEEKSAAANVKAYSDENRKWRNTMLRENPILKNRVYKRGK